MPEAKIIPLPMIRYERKKPAPKPEECGSDPYWLADRLGLDRAPNPPTKKD